MSGPPAHGALAYVSHTPLQHVRGEALPRTWVPNDLLTSAETQPLPERTRGSVGTHGPLVGGALDGVPRGRRVVATPHHHGERSQHPGDGGPTEEQQRQREHDAR